MSRAISKRMTEVWRNKERRVVRQEKEFIEPVAGISMITHRQVRWIIEKLEGNSWVYEATLCEVEQASILKEVAHDSTRRLVRVSWGQPTRHVYQALDTDTSKNTWAVLQDWTESAGRSLLVGMPATA